MCISNLDVLDAFRAIPMDQIHLLRRFDITLTYVWRRDKDEFRRSLREACIALSTIPKLDYVRVTYSGIRGDEIKDFISYNENMGNIEDIGDALQAYLGLLRGVRVVVLENIPSCYADNIKRKMMGFEPEDPLPKMYRVLERYALSTPICRGPLERAQRAVELGDIESFDHNRETIVRRMTRHMDKITRELCRNGPGGKIDGGEAQPPTWAANTSLGHMETGEAASPAHT